jgi:ribosomal protein RSM22 (predicted rRNA methylase)
LQPRKHFGVNKIPISQLPDKILKAMTVVAGDHSLSKLVEAGNVLNRYLYNRKVPLEDHSMRDKVREIEEMVDSDPKKYRLPETRPDPDNEIASLHYKEMRKNRIETLIRQRVYGWQSIEYDDYKSLLYLFGRAPQEYATLIKIFSEIQKRDSTFKPRTFFDFGSGVGTSVWASSQIWKSIYEYYLVDTSKYMNDLSDLMLRDGDENKNSWIKNVYHRQFLPSKHQTYDVVVSAYSMFEQPTLKNRLEIANNLWNKAENYLIFIENGTNSGFNLLNEIREFLMDFKVKNNEEAFIFSPCPHESECPRFTLNDGTPCNFEVRFHSLPFTRPIQIHSHLYSYLVIKKGTPNAECDRWPRLVRPTLVRSKHTICRLCTQQGKLQEVIFTQAKHGQAAYRCARHSNWSDQFPSNSIQTYDIDTKAKRIEEKISNLKLKNPENSTNENDNNSNSSGGSVNS